MSTKLYGYGSIDEQYINGDILEVKVLTQLQQDTVRKYYDLIIVFRREKFKIFIVLISLHWQIDLIKNYN